MTDYERNIVTRIESLIMAGELSTECQVQILAVVGDYLGLKSRTAYEKKYGLSYNGVKNHRHNVELFGCKLVIDNL